MTDAIVTDIKPVMKPLTKALMRSLRTDFSPLSLFASGEEGLWSRPKYSAKLFKNAAGTDPVTTADDPVGLMLDDSGNGNDAVQATTGSKMRWADNGSGLYGIEAIDDGDFIAATAGSAISDFTIVARFTCPASQGFIAGVGDSGTNFSLFYLDASLQLRVATNVGGAGNKGGTLIGPALTTGNVYTAIYKLNAATGQMSVHLYGGTIQSVTGDASFSSTGMFLSGAYNSTFAFKAPIHEVIIVDRLLTDTEIDDVAQSMEAS